MTPPRRFALPLVAFEVGCALFPEWPPTIVNARTAGQAKAMRHAGIADAWPDVPFTAMRARAVGAPQTSAAFRRVAEMRGRPEVRCGDRIVAGERAGTIVGHNDSANWNVLFDDGTVGNVHPGECRYLAQEAP